MASSDTNMKFVQRLVSATWWTWPRVEHIASDGITSRASAPKRFNLCKSACSEKSYELSIQAMKSRTVNVNVSCDIYYARRSSSPTVVIIIIIITLYVNDRNRLLSRRLPPSINRAPSIERAHIISYSRERLAAYIRALPVITSSRTTDATMRR